MPGPARPDQPASGQDLDYGVQTMRRDQWDEVATLIHDSTNAWYQTHRNRLVFQSGPQSTRLFCEVYETLDPGCCLLAVRKSDQKILGSCFYHPRPTHVSLGIMNVHPSAFGRGIARELLQRVKLVAERADLPLRLVSSAMNLDSFSLYTRAGMVPRQTCQDLMLQVPELGIPPGDVPAGQIREATRQDISAMGALERQVSGICRPQDYELFVGNPGGYWHVSVLYHEEQLQGWIVSIAHPASQMIGPGVACNQQIATALLRHELNHRAGSTMVFLVPVDCDQIVQAAYAWGARNCELHVVQVYGDYQTVQGVAFPTFMPETG